MDFFTAWLIVSLSRRNVVRRDPSEWGKIDVSYDTTLVRHVDLYGIIRKEKFCFQYSSESSHLQISVISKRPFHRSIQDICNNLKFILLFCSVNLKFNFIQLTFVDPCIIVQFVQRNPTRCNSVSKFIIPYLYETQQVSGDTPPAIRSLNLH